jgi:hypothetical protein
MKILATLLAVAALASFASAEEAWRWTDANGTVHYTNRPDVAPRDATTVKTRLTVEAEALPGAPDLVLDGGDVVDAHDRAPEARAPRRRPHRIYTDERLRFDCYAAGVLYSGGWSHPDDINVGYGCLPYHLGPEAWLNGARAELAMRQNGIDWRDVLHMYFADREQEMPRRTSAVSAPE